jgi:glycosyltransferase involved in cell wall biosynthesis
MGRSNVAEVGRPGGPWQEASGEHASKPFSLMFVTNSWLPEPDGVAPMESRLVHGLREHGHDVHVVRPRQGRGHDLPTDSRETLVPGIPIPFYRDLRMGLPAYGPLRRLIERVQPDVIHVASEGPLGWSAVSAARHAGIPVSAEFHANLHLHRRYSAMGMLAPMVLTYLHTFHHRVDGTTVPTKKLARELLTQGVDHVFVIERGVDATFFSPARRSMALRREWHAFGSAPVVLYVGRLASTRDVHLVFRAFAAIRIRMPDARLVLVGDGPLRASIEQSEPATVVLGARHGQALADCYAAGDLLLVTSRAEISGNAILEAAASGLTIVAFDHGAAGELIEDGVNGCLVPYADDEAFVAAARALAHAPHQIARLGAAARLVAAAHPWERIITEFESYLRHALIEPSREVLPLLNGGDAGGHRGRSLSSSN